MQTKIENIDGCSRVINIEVSAKEISQKFDQVYSEIRKKACIPGFRPGKAPRDLLEVHYGEKAKDEVIKRAIPEYYLRAVKEIRLAPVAPPEIENVQFTQNRLCFKARVDVKPQVKIKGYKDLRVIKKRIKIEQSQIDQVLERLRQSKAKVQNKEKKEAPPELDDRFARDSGFKTLQDLKDAIKENLHANAEIEIRRDMERQLLEQLLKRASLSIPESLVNSQTQEVFNQLRLNCVLQGEKKEDIQSKEKELRAQAREEAVLRVKLSFILERIAQLENIQVEDKDLDERIIEIVRRTGRTEDEVRRYLQRQNLIPGLKAELRDKKTIEFLLKEARIEEEGRR